MTSRYDYMEASKVKDEISNDYFPDVLSLNYLNFKMSDIPNKDIMSDDKINLFWREAYNYYGTCQYDDIVLTLNGIAHKNFLKSGDVIYFPKVSDINSSFAKDRTV